jgi:hypothetical protein
VSDEEPSPTPIPVSVRLFISGAVIATASLFAVVLRDGSVPGPAALAAFLALAVPVWWIGETRISGAVTISLISVLLLGAAVVLGPLGAGLLGLGFGLLTRGGMPAWARVFNGALGAASGLVGGLAYLAAGGSTQPATLHGAASLATELGFPLLAADVCQALVNAVLIAGIMRVSQGVPLRLMAARLLESGPVYVAYGILAFLLIVLWFPAGVGPASSLLILLPLVAAHWTYVQYAAQEHAREQSLDLLVGALELKVPALRGHSSRVADLAARAAEHLGMGPAEVLDVRRAAMLHDLGHLRHSSGDGPRHAQRAEDAARLVGGLSFLAGACEVLRSLARPAGGRSRSAQLVSGASALDRSQVVEPDDRSAAAVVIDLRNAGLVSAEVEDALVWAISRTAGGPGGHP